MSIDVLQEKIIALKNPTVAGLDPLPEHVPEHIMASCISRHGGTLRAAAAAYLEFNRALIDALCDIVPAVKLQSACYELLGADGVEAFRETAAYARSKGMYVIGDVKRGDIGSTAEAYSAAYLGAVRIGMSEISPFGLDAVTVSPYLGTDGIRPFLEKCLLFDRAIFVLVKTSNPSSAEFQDLVSGDRRVYTVVADTVEKLGESNVGRYGYSRVGAVVGATYPEELKFLRERMRRTFFLVPGYGAQGASASDVAHAFDGRGRGAVINSSRAIIAAWKKTGDGYLFAEAARAEALKMRGELLSVISIE